MHNFGTVPDGTVYIFSEKMGKEGEKMPDIFEVRGCTPKEKETVVEIVRLLDGYPYNTAVGILGVAQDVLAELTRVHSESYRG